MAIKNRADLTAELIANITDNTSGQNTATRVREIVQDIIDSSLNIDDEPPVLRKVKVTLDMNSTDPQPITLAGGTLFDIADIRLLNASAKLNTAAGLLFYDDIDQDDQIFVGTDALGFAHDGLYVVNTIHGISMRDMSNIYNSKTAITNVPTNILVGSSITTNTIYAFLTTPEGSAKTVDCYVYYYVIE